MTNEIARQGEIDSGVLAELETVAERIRARERRITSDIIATGDDLLLVKERLGHGQFLDWIATEFGMTDRTARNYMSAAAWARGKSETVSDLPLTVLYALATKSTPAVVEKAVLAEVEAGRPVKPETVAEWTRQSRAPQAPKDDPGQPDYRTHRRKTGLPVRQTPHARRDDFLNAVSTITTVADVLSDAFIERLENAEHEGAVVADLERAQRQIVAFSRRVRAIYQGDTSEDPPR